MDELLAYLNSLDADDRTDFAARCGTTVGYIRKACSIKSKIDVSLAINIERESAGAVRCEVVRPDVDWAFLRGAA